MLFVLISVQEKPCGAGMGMRCEGLVDRAAWRMSGVGEVRLSSWSIFFRFDFQFVFGPDRNLCLELNDLFGKKHNIGALEF